jgi:hypothetical protein
MSGYWTGEASFVDAIIGPRSITCAAIVDDELAADRIAFTKIALLMDGVWEGGGELKWDVICVTRCAVPIKQYAIVGVLGKALFVGGGSTYEEDIQDGTRSPASIGALRDARSIGGVLYACGMKRQVYRRADRGRWSLLDAGFTPEPGVTGFESLDGFNENEIYAVGWEGEIWQYDGAVWTRRDSGTNVILIDVLCAGDGQVYVLGRGRKLIRGRGSQWEVLELNLPVDLWSLAWFEGRLYACSMRDIFVWEDDGFQPLIIEGDRPKTVQYLSVAEGGLCAVGPKDIFHFDGKTWTRID